MRLMLWAAHPSLWREPEPVLLMVANTKHLKQDKGQDNVPSLVLDGGGEGSRTPVLDTCYVSFYMFSW